MIGLLFRKYDIDNKCSKKTNMCMLLLFLTASSLLLFFYEDFYFYKHELYDWVASNSIWVWPLRLLCASMWSLFFILLFKKYTIRYNWFSYCGTLTMGIYFLQQPIFNGLMARKFELQLPTLLYIITGFAAAFVVLVAVTFASFVLKKYTISRELFLGELKL